MATDKSWDAEADRYGLLTGERRVRWLAQLIFALTIFARDTYTVGESGLTDPVRMRRFNELAHRVASQLRNELDGTAGLPSDAFLEMVSEELKALGVRADDFRKLLS
jgi:hypothetical protein